MLKTIVSFFILMLVLQISVSGQLISRERNLPYLRVFIDTDNFDSTCLQQLEAGWESTLPDTIRLAVGCDLAYYWHTRNLYTALYWAYRVWEMVSQTEKPYWSAKIQVVLGVILLRQEKLDTAIVILERAKRKLPQSEWALLLTQ